MQHVSDPSQAIEALQNSLKQSQPINLILLDVLMDVIRFMSFVKSNETLREIPIIVMSYPDQTELAYRCLREGADDYYLKPIRVEVVKGVWQNVWRRRKEKKVMESLDEERRIRREMEEKIGLLEDQVSQALEAPIHLITRTVTSLLKNSDMSDSARTSLLSVLGILKSSNLYRPTFDKMLASNKIDLETRQWLAMQVFGDSGSSLDLTSPVPNFHSDRSSRVLSEIISMTAVSSEPYLAEPSRIEALRRWDFDVWTHSEDDLVQYLIDMFVNLELVGCFQIPIPTLKHFLTDIKSGYLNANPYHNFRHAFDVAHAVYIFLTTTCSKDLLTPLDVFGLMVAAVCHDLQHPGCTNSFQVASESPLAFRFNDQSVLENLHCYSTFVCLKKPANSIFQSLNPLERKEIRAIIIKCILATDLTLHMDILSKFNAAVPTFNKENKKDRMILVEILMKCGDISNPLRPLQLAKHWADMIQEEQFLQVLGSSFRNREGYLFERYRGTWRSDLVFLCRRSWTVIIRNRLEWESDSTILWLPRCFKALVSYYLLLRRTCPHWRPLANIGIRFYKATHQIQAPTLPLCQLRPCHFPLGRVCCLDPPATTFQDAICELLVA